MELSPNVVGIVGGQYGSAYMASGAFYGSFATIGGIGLQNGQATINSSYFSANSSNATYTDTGKVYPASIALNYILKA